MRLKFAVLLGATALLSACVTPGGPAATSWGGASYFVRPYGYAYTSSKHHAQASIASFGSLTSVSTSAGKSTGSTVATDGSNTVMSSRAGDAESSLGTNGGATAIAVSTGGAAASLVTDGKSSSGSTSAGSATSVW